MVRTLLLSIAAISAAHAQASAVLTGTVVDSATRLPVHALLTPSAGTRDVTAADGSFSLHELPAGEVKVHVAAAGYRALDTTAKISDGDHQTSFFELHPLARITGKVVDKVTGEPIVRNIRILNEGRFSSGAATGKDGSFEFASLEPGNYTLGFDAGGEALISWDPQQKAQPRNSYGPSYPETIHLAEGEQKSIVIRLTAAESHSVSGVLEFPAGIDEATVVIGYGFGGGGLNEMQALGKHRAGNFRIDGLLPGAYQVLAIVGEGAGRAYGFASVNLSDHDVDGLIVKLTPGIRVTGSIRMLEEDTTFPKLPNQLAFLMPSDRGIAAPSEPMIVEGSRFRGDGMPQGDYWANLLGVPFGYAVTDVFFGNASTLGRPISLYGTGELTFIVTSKPGMIVGTVRDRNQAPVKTGDVTLIQRSTADPQQVRHSPLDEAGEFRFRNLAPGWYTIEGVPPIEVKPNQTVTVTLTR